MSPSADRPSSISRWPRPIPRLPRAVAAEAERQETGLELIASENFVSAAVLEAAGLGAHQQVRRGLPRQALLRRLRARRRRRDAGHRPRQGAVRRRARQRAAALRRPGQHGRATGDAGAGRHHPRRWTWPTAATSRTAIRSTSRASTSTIVPYGVRQRRRAHRLRRGGAAGRGAQAEADHRRRQRLSARDRLRRFARDRRRGRRRC